MTVKQRATIALALSSALASGASARPAEFAVADFAEDRPPGIQVTGEVPAGRLERTVSGEWVADGDVSPGAARMNYDFATGGNTGRMQLHVLGYFPSKATGLILSVRSSNDGPIIVQVHDKSGESYHGSIDYTGGGDWQKLAVDFAPGMKGWMSGGGDYNGLLDTPIKEVYIGVAPSAQTMAGTLDVDHVTAVTPQSPEELEAERAAYTGRAAAPPGVVAPSVVAAPNAAVPAGMKDVVFTFATAVPGNLFHPGEDVRATLKAVTPPAGVDSIPVALKVLDAADEVVAELPPLTLTADGDYVAEVELPAKPGYYRLSAQVGGEANALAARYAVIPPPPAGGKNPASPFGVNTHFNQGWPRDVGAIVKRAGIGWVRDGQASMRDQAVLVAEENGLCYFPVFTWYRAPQAKHKRADGTYDFSELADWYRGYAQKYGDRIDYYDLHNEPHGPWMAVLGGNWAGGPWLKDFAVYGRQVSAAIKAGDPGAKVIWEDIDQFKWAYQLHDMGLGNDEIDGISPHPYSFHRANPWPETQAMMGQLAAYHAFKEKNDLDWPIWVGEVGYSAHRPGPKPHGAYDPYTEAEQAQLLVRLMVSQLANGVEKVFWYDMRNDGWDPIGPEHNFGLIRMDDQPKPAVVAYANLIHRIGGAEWIDRLQLQGGDGSGYLYTFAPDRTGGRPTVVAWVKTGERTVTAKLPAGVEGVTVTDIYGKTTPLSVEGGKVSLELSESPVFIEGLDRPAITALMGAF